MSAPDPRYPIGKFEYRGDPDPRQRAAWIDEIAALPAAFRAALAGLRDDQLDTPYRPGGWTVRQVAHHVPDSHMNAYVRFKLALTEETPTIKPYDEARWAETDDVRDTPVAVSLALLEALHQRWVALLRGMGEADFRRAFYHPETSATLPLARVLGLYAWHGRHHTAHVTTVRGRMGW
ncbi:MAG TPA: bacillithiol transferase BstA [Gemmatimonadaceae bacterium]|nr:bacillithiol transferase BstA [Gemmatimonadaceae bacterium]